MVELIFEILLEVFVEGLFELGLYSVQATRNKERNPVLAFVGYVIVGIICGFISLLIFKDYFITSKNLMIINLFLSPLIAGGLFVLLDRYRTKKGSEEVQLGKFLYGFIFAFMIALVRYIYFKYFQ